MTLLEGLQEEMNRVREIIKIYDKLPNNAGDFVSGMMKQSVKKAESLIVIGDIIEIAEAYKELKEYEEYKRY